MLSFIMRNFRIPSLLISVVFLCSSCKTYKKDSEIVNLDDLKGTEFVVSLESPVDSTKNTIYTPTFLFAWQEVKQKLGIEIVVGENNSTDFIHLNQSGSWQNSLSDTEYSTDVDINEGAVSAEAYFDKSLPFEMPLDKLVQPIIFDGMAVDGFGMSYFKESLVESFEILYYHDDDFFILKLIPRDHQHEIILAKGIRRSDNLWKDVQQVKSLVEQGRTERSSADHSWKYFITLLDRVAIPVVGLNAKANFNQLEGQRFRTADDTEHHIQTALQRTRFVLNEKGAEVESEAYAVVDSVGMIPEQPKDMRFDKPFYIMVKRTNTMNPYFVMYVRNAELLVKR